MRIYLAKNLLEANQNCADNNRQLLHENKVLMVNLLGSPGSGKTQLLQETFKQFELYRTAVIEGDLFTAEDAEKLTPWCDKAVQINTEGSCHLEAAHIWHILQKENLLSFDLLFIENIGNLVCPAEFDLGENLKVIALSVAEGNDKPRKYPMAFKSAEVALITKIDLLPFCDFSVDRALDDLTRINPDLKVIAVSAKTGEGLNNWFHWLENKLMRIKKSVSS